MCRSRVDRASVVPRNRPYRFLTVLIGGLIIDAILYDLLSILTPKMGLGKGFLGLIWASQASKIHPKTAHVRDPFLGPPLDPYLVPHGTHFKTQFGLHFRVVGPLGRTMIVSLFEPTRISIGFKWLPSSINFPSILLLLGPCFDGFGWPGA